MQPKLKERERGRGRGREGKERKGEEGGKKEENKGG